MNANPTPIHWFKDGKFRGPYVYGGRMKRDQVTKRKVFNVDTSRIYKVKFWVAGSKYKLFGLIPTSRHLFGVEAGAKIFLFGADSMGRDLFSRMLIGSQISLTIPFVGTAISFVMGIIFGGISGYFGGAIDNVIQRIIEVLTSLPTIPLWMALSAAIPADIPTVKIYLYITIILSFISWTSLARVVRGSFISMKHEDYIMAARLGGVSDFKIILIHMVPGFMSYLIVNLTLEIPKMIIGETSMSFLGLGIRSPATSWGVLLEEMKTITSIAIYPWRLIPLFAVIITVLAFNFLGDGLRDAADPYK
jgi:peptide/nickel transport system permease protein